MRVLFIICFFFSSLQAVMAQEIISVEPGAANAGQSLEVTITGNNTHFSSATNTVYFYFTSGTSTITMANNVAAKNNVTLKAHIKIPAAAKSGYYSVGVRNDYDGLVNKQNAFYVYGSSTVETVSPSNGKAGETLVVTITGNNTQFTQATNTVQLLFSSGTSTLTTASKITVNNDTSLTARFTLPANTKFGHFDIEVYNGIDRQLIKQKSFLVKQANAIDNTHVSLKMGISPNPFVNRFFVDVFSKENAAATLEIIDVQGKILKSEKTIIMLGDNKIPVHAEIPKGMYIVKVTTATACYTARAIKI